MDSATPVVMAMIGAMTILALAFLLEDKPEPSGSNVTNAHPVIHDFKMNAGGNNVSAD